MILVKHAHQVDHTIGIVVWVAKGQTKYEALLEALRNAGNFGKAPQGYSFFGDSMVTIYA